MATAVANFRTTQSGIVQLAERELRAFWLTLDPSEPLAAVRALENFLPLLIQSYGEMGAAAAADFYEELRESVPGIRRAHKTVLGDAIPFEQARISTKWAVGPLFKADEDPTAAYNNLIDVTDRLVKQQGRNTIAENIIRDPAGVRYARVPSGPQTCTYCLMLASRGAVYLSKESASNLNKYHGKCDCVATPVWNNDLTDLKTNEGYDPEVYYDRWQEALEAEQAAKAAK